MALEIWTCAGKVMLRNTNTSEWRELKDVHSVNFTDGTKFPPPEESDVAVLKDGRLTATSSTLRTLSGGEVTVKSSRDWDNPRPPSAKVG